MNEQLEQHDRDVFYCKAILEWAGENENFDPSFVEKLYNILEKGNDLTPKQSLALINIYEKFNIGE